MVIEDLYLANSRRWFLLTPSRVERRFDSQCWRPQVNKKKRSLLMYKKLPPITHYWTVSLILDHSYLVGNLTNSEIAETKALEPLES